MDTPGVLVVVSDSQGRIIRFNGECERASGYSQEEVLGRSLTQFLRFREGEHPGGAVFERPEPGHFPHKLECRLIGRGGEEVWVAWSNRAELHSDGSVRWVISTGVDITERNQALRNLQLFRQGIERSGEVVFLTDLEGRIIYVNPAFEETYGIPGEEAIGGTPRVLKSGVQSPEIYEAFWRKITRGEMVQGEFVNRARDGRIVHVEGSANPILDEDGRPVAFLAIQRDVTKRIETETALKQSEERFRTLMEKIPEGLAVVTGEGQVRYANPAFLRLLGKSPDEVQGRMVQEFMPQEEGRAFGKEIRVTQGGKADLDGEFHLTRAGGESTPVSVSARSLELGGQSVVLLTFQDLSERKRLEDRLRHSQKMQAVGQLAGGIAHDFNNLLTVIQANTDLLLSPGGLMEGGGGPDTAELLEVQKAARKGKGLVQKLLAFSRREQLSYTSVDLGSLLLELRPTLRRLLPANISIELVVPDRLPPIRADSGSVEQILLNLATNARDAMPEGGALSVHLNRSHFPDSEFLEEGGRAPGEFVCITVTDQGSGMDRETRERAFEPFFTTKTVGKGTGLGMAAVYGLVEAHGGMVNLYSTVGVGTTVRIDLPVAGAWEGKSATSFSPVKKTAGIPELAGGTETILVVEDEPALRKAARKTLELVGYRVFVARDGLAGLDIYRELGSEIDLILTDLIMPRMGGRRLYQAVKEEGNHTRFLFASGYDTETAVGEEELRRELPFLAKPWTIQELTQRVREVLDRGPSA